MQFFRVHQLDLEEIFLNLKNFFETPSLKMKNARSRSEMGLCFKKMKVLTEIDEFKMSSIWIPNGSNNSC